MTCRIIFPFDAFFFCPFPSFSYLFLHASPMTIFFCGLQSTVILLGINFSSDIDDSIEKENQNIKLNQCIFLRKVYILLSMMSILDFKLKHLFVILVLYHYLYADTKQLHNCASHRRKKNYVSLSEGDK